MARPEQLVSLVLKEQTELTERSEQQVWPELTVLTERLALKEQQALPVPREPTAPTALMARPEPTARVALLAQPARQVPLARMELKAWLVRRDQLVRQVPLDPETKELPETQVQLVRPEIPARMERRVLRAKASARCSREIRLRAKPLSVPQDAWLPLVPSIIRQSVQMRSAPTRQAAPIQLSVNQPSFTSHWEITTLPWGTALE
jgi:hypothetical protein